MDNKNCIYFGKIQNIKMLEEIINIYLHLLKKDKSDIEQQLYNYENKLLQLYNFNNKNADISECTKIIQNQINKERKCIYKYNNILLDKCKKMIEYTLEYIFGIGIVYLYIITEKDPYYAIFNSEIYATPYFKLRLDNYNSNRNICYKYLNINKEIILDNQNKECYINDIRTNINISLTDGIKFNTKYYSPTIFILLPEKIEQFYFTSEEWISIILHEIGHIFAYILFDLNLLTDRINEKFADLFVSLYGYSSEFINSKRKELSMRLYLKYIGKIKQVQKKNVMTFALNINKFNILRENIIDINNHSCIYIRSLNLLKQLQLEQKNINLTKSKRIELNKEISKIKKSINIMKYNPYYPSDISIQAKLFIKNNYKYIINNFCSDILEKISEKINKLDNRLFKNIINNLQKKKFLAHCEGFL